MKKRSFEIFFLDKDSQKANIGSQRVIVILSPSFYWFHKEKLKISPSQAKKIAPSMFEGIAPEDNYSYYVEKIGDEYWFFAYKDEDILNKLSEVDLKPSQIKKVYPAQIAFSSLQKPIKVGETVYFNENGTVVGLPEKIVKFKGEDLKNVSLHLPKSSFPLKAYATFFVSEDLLYKFSIALGIAILLFGITFYIKKRDLDMIDNQSSSLFEKYHLPSTSIQLKNIMHSLEKKEKKQMALRNTLEYLLRAPLQSKEFFTTLEIGSKVSFEIKNVSQNSVKRLKNYFSKRCAIQSIAFNNNILSIECRYE